MTDEESPPFDEIDAPWPFRAVYRVDGPWPDVVTVKHMRRIEVFGRTIALEADVELDNYGQFEVRLSVDGKPRFVAHFTDKSDAD